MTIEYVVAGLLSMDASKSALSMLPAFPAERPSSGEVKE